MRKTVVVDLFAGAGGAFGGADRAATRLGLMLEGVAVNHWPIAIQTHQANFPDHRHYCDSIARVEPREAVPGGVVHLLMAGPECTHFSNARGAVPKNPQSRASAWDILKWVEQLDVHNILIENVPEFLTWGPLDAAGRPIKDGLGSEFLRFVGALVKLGYNVEHRVLCAAHFGAATTRRRLFIQATRGKVCWPVPTHHAPDAVAAYPGMSPWRGAVEVLDFSLPTQSLFHRKRPLRPATLARIEAGVRKFWGWEGLPDGPVPVRIEQVDGVVPYLVVLRNNADSRALSEPVPTLCTGNHVYLVQPLLVGVGGPRGKQHARSVTEPMGTVVGQSHQAVIQPFLVKYYGGHDAQSVNAPLPTVTANYEHFGLLQPLLMRYNGAKRVGETRGQALDLPIGTLDTSNRYGLMQPLLIPYYGNSKQALSVHDPCPTVTANDHLGLAVPTLVPDEGEYLLDIGFRMLQVPELAAAQGFSPSCRFAGNKGEQVKQIGNAWEGHLAEALCYEILKGGADHA